MLSGSRDYSLHSCILLRHHLVDSIDITLVRGAWLGRLSRGGQGVRVRSPVWAPGVPAILDILYKVLPAPETRPRRRADLSLQVPSAVRILQPDTGTTSRSSFLTFVQWNGLHLCSGDDQKFGLIESMVDQEVRYGHFGREDANFFDDDWNNFVVVGMSCGGGRPCIDDLQDSAIICADEEDIVCLPRNSLNLGVDGNLRKSKLETGLQDNGLSPEGRDRLVHEGVVLDEVDSRLSKGGRILCTSPRSRIRDFRVGHWEPVGVGVLLSLELPIKCCLHVVHTKCTHCRGSEGIDRGCKDSINQLLTLSTVCSRREGCRRLNLIKVEGEVSWNRTVEPCLDKGGEGCLRYPSRILLADSSHSREDSLATVDVLDGSFPEEEVNIILSRQGGHEVGLVEMFGIILISP